MKNIKLCRFVMYSLASVLLLLSGCSDPGYSVTEPEANGLLDGFSVTESLAFEIECQTNMLDLAYAETQFYASNNTYTDILEDLYEVLGYAPLCPACGEEYFLEATNNTYCITCPNDPSHGWKNQTEQSWPPWDPLAYCQNNMTWLSNAQSMYYAIYSCYASSIEDLLQEFPLIPSTCPTCGELYDVGSPEPGHYYIYCPDDWQCHGWIIDGETSWGILSHDHETYCRNNMLSIRTGQSLYYGKHNRYAKSMEELSEVMGTDLFCLSCGEEYIVGSPEPDHYYIMCPYDNCHGWIRDDITSWE